MSADFSRAYEVLGVKPGISVRELKAAHRDLAKVWHPDRFLHDPRLQEKAQEKLKEINEAYEQIVSGKVPRPVATPTEPRAATVKPRREKSSSWTGLAILVFVAVFAITISVLLRQRTQPVPEEIVTTVEHDQPQPIEVNETPRKAKRESEVPEVASVETVVTEPTPAVATVTVTVDPESGLLAKQDCKLRSRMTYPSGSEPSSYCNLVHTPPPKRRFFLPQRH